MKKLLFLTLAPLFYSLPACALDLWRYPEPADKNALFLDASLAAVSFTDGFSYGTATLEFRFDYIIPLFLPFSLGAYFRAPNPNLKSFGARVGYHFDIQDRQTDLYFLYVFDLGFLRNDLLLEYGDEEQEMRLYDFRAGARRLFGKYFCLSLETAFKLSGISIGVSLKLN
jgi:hypothetical protein